MDKILREDIHIISQNSNLSKEQMEQALREHVYPNETDWLKMIRLFVLSLGIGFSVAGIIFFFAYNWDDLSRFTKIGLTQALVIVSTGIVLIPKIDLLIRRIVLTAASILVGVLFAVYGQIYQTGANAYDFFLAWTISITLWVLVADFAALWLLYVFLINLTFVLYSEQVARDWNEDFILFVLFLFNASAHIAAIFNNHRKNSVVSPAWFTNILALAAFFFATNSYLSAIDDSKEEFNLALVFAPLFYGLAVWYSFKRKTIFYLASVAISLIVGISATVLIKNESSSSIFLFLCFFIVAAVSLAIIFLIRLQKEWANEKS